ncbi:hypothetical protein MNBD_DELTA04-1792 [hydrothermal vent metagenome]|uniref:HTH domain of SpoOJ/ParA/ParB/repB family, involved in chromosome partitioning n=1 Tax=hydrothermal vent metagenome TaxID=652676 RepID=A0A3B0W2T4_9ZZZZ
MAIVAPFRGVRFNPDKIKNLEDVVTPPYDVISEADGTAFLEKNLYNMIQLDLRNSTLHGSDSEAGRYAEARTRFDAWQDDQILIRDDRPAIYLYYIDYTHPSGRRLTRKGLISLVGLAEFSEGIVKPHEKTFATVVAERLELMKACRAQFSQVFSLYHDRENIVIKTLEQAREPEPVCSVTDHFGNVHTVWRVTDPQALAGVAGYFADKPVYIADGHHRYTTALSCRKQALAEQPDLPADSPLNFTMMYLCSAEDDGLSVLPTHRLVTFPGRLSADEVVRKMKAGLRVEELKSGSREVLIAEVLSRMNEAEMTLSAPVFGLYHAGEDRCFFLRLKDENTERSASLARLPQVLQQLDVVVFSELLIQEYLGLDHQRCVREKLISYFSDPDDAIDVSVKKSIADDNVTPLLFLLNPTRVQQVTDVADSGEIMPHKSTYFYPKIMTGLLINKLVAAEKIQGAG